MDTNFSYHVGSETVQTFVAVFIDYEQGRLIGLSVGQVLIQSD